MKRLGFIWDSKRRILYALVTQCEIGTEGEQYRETEVLYEQNCSPLRCLQRIQQCFWLQSSLSYLSPNEINATCSLSPRINKCSYLVASGDHKSGFGDHLSLDLQQNTSGFSPSSKFCTRCISLLLHVRWERDIFHPSPEFSGTWEERSVSLQDGTLRSNKNLSHCLWMSPNP